MAADLNVSYLTDVLGDLLLDGAVPLIQRYVSQNTKTEPYPLLDWQPVKIAEKPGDVFRMPCREHQSGGSVED